MNFLPKVIYTWCRNTLRNPKYRWWVILGSLVYLLSPFDISPDLVPFLGQIDDLLLVSLLVTEVIQVIREQKQSSQKDSDDVDESESTNSQKTIDVKAVSLD